MKLRGQRTRLLCGLAALALVGSAWAGPVEDGLEAAKAEDYATALRLWRPEAERGDPTAQSYLGRLYLLGWGVPQDYAEAARWYGKAAEQGNQAAQNNLGHLYENGRGVPQDYAKALSWYRKSAATGALESIMNIGRIYEDGLGVPADCGLAREWYARAARSSFSGAQEALRRVNTRCPAVPSRDPP